VAYRKKEIKIKIRVMKTITEYINESILTFWSALKQELTSIYEFADKDSNIKKLFGFRDRDEVMSTGNLIKALCEYIDEWVEDDPAYKKDDLRKFLSEKTDILIKSYQGYEYGWDEEKMFEMFNKVSELVCKKTLI